MFWQAVDADKSFNRLITAEEWCKSVWQHCEKSSSCTDSRQFRFSKIVQNQTSATPSSDAEVTFVQHVKHGAYTKPTVLVDVLDDELAVLAIGRFEERGSNLLTLLTCLRHVFKFANCDLIMSSGKYLVLKV